MGSHLKNQLLNNRILHILLGILLQLMLSRWTMLGGKAMVCCILLALRSHHLVIIGCQKYFSFDICIPITVDAFHQDGKRQIEVLPAVALLLYSFVIVECILSLPHIVFTDNYQYLSKFTAIDRSPAPPPSNCTALLIDFDPLGLFLCTLRVIKRIRCHPLYVLATSPNCRASAERRPMGERKTMR